MTQEVQTPAKRTPRIAIMGEFSAGKSTLCNLLMRTRALPERVTATRLAPVWMTKAPGRDIRMTLDGNEEPVYRKALDQIPFDDTLYIRLCLEADILDHCDFIDFPGISDPNMDAVVWERVLVEADAVIWLTHATQAWRQSESAVWDTVPDEVREKSILLVTRFDKLVSESDRTRVMARVKKEAGPYFDRVFPISLTDALEAQDNYEAWTDSGAEAVMDHLAELIGTLAEAAVPAKAEPTPATSAEVHQMPNAAPAEQPEQPAVSVTVPSVEQPKTQPEPESNTPRIIPRRVKPNSSLRRERPSALRA